MEYFEIIIKTTYYFFVLVFLIRILGKREVGEISVFDLVVLLVLADIATLGIDGNWEELLISTISLFILVGLQKLVAFIVVKFPKLRGVVDYKPSILIHNGRLNLNELKKQSYTIDDLITQARSKGVMDLCEIRLAILESSGELSIYTKSFYKNEVLPVIVSGVLVTENLSFLKLEEKNIYNYLSNHKIKLKNVHYLASDGTNFYQLEIL